MLYLKNLMKGLVNYSYFFWNMYIFNEYLGSIVLIRYSMRYSCDCGF